MEGHRLKARLIKSDRNHIDISLFSTRTHPYLFSHISQWFINSSKFPIGTPALLFRICFGGGLQNREHFTVILIIKWVPFKSCNFKASIKHVPQKNLQKLRPHTRYGTKHGPPGCYFFIHIYTRKKISIKHWRQRLLLCRKGWTIFEHCPPHSQSCCRVRWYFICIDF